MYYFVAINENTLVYRLLTWGVAVSDAYTQDRTTLAVLDLRLSKLIS
jgi:hypothetical protein